MEKEFPRLFSTGQPTLTGHVLTVLFTLLWTCDTIFTIIFTYHGGLDLEANPLMRQLLIMEHGYVGFIVIKLAALSFWLTFASRAKIWVHVLLNVVMLYPVGLGGIMAWNFLT